MKKKMLALICGGFIALSLFAAPGNPVKAAEDEDCTCHNVTPIYGVQKNKIIANLISSQEFKNAKLSIIKDGDNWRGINNTEVFVHNSYGITIVGVPFIAQDGTIMMATFFDGFFMGSAPRDE